MTSTRALLLLGVVLGAASLSACGRAAGARRGEGRGGIRWPGDAAAASGVRGDSGSPEEEEAGLQTVAQLRKLRPLSNADVKLYADVMSAAVARLDHPTAEDRRVLARSDALQRGVAAGDPAPSPAAAEAASRAVILRTRMDDEIVRQRHIDARWYGLVRDRIESVIPPVDAYGVAGAAPAPEIAGEDELARLSEERRKADAALLAPRRAELQRLIRRVRTPATEN